MSIALVVTRGYGNGTLSGAIADVVLRGYTIGEIAAEYDLPFSADVTKLARTADTAKFRRTTGVTSLSRTVDDLE